MADYQPYWSADEREKGQSSVKDRWMYEALMKAKLALKVRETSETNQRNQTAYQEEE